MKGCSYFFLLQSTIEFPSEFEKAKFEREGYITKWCLDHEPSQRPTALELLEVKNFFIISIRLLPFQSWAFDNYFIIMQGFSKKFFYAFIKIVASMRFKNMDFDLANSQF